MLVTKRKYCNICISVNGSGNCHRSDSDIIAKIISFNQNDIFKKWKTMRNWKRSVWWDITDWMMFVYHLYEKLLGLNWYWISLSNQRCSIVPTFSGFFYIFVLFSWNLIFLHLFFLFYHLFFGILCCFLKSNSVF